MALELQHKTRVVPHRFIEYGYYFSMFYAVMGPALGLSISFFGSGLVAGLAMLCLFTLGFHSKSLFASIGFPLGCALSVVIIQCLWHGEYLLGPYVQPFIFWVFSLVIVQSLALRKGFLHRFTMVMFFIGLSTLPFLSIHAPGNDEVQRIGLSREVGLSNPNILAAWFAFCFVYFTILGFMTKQKNYRFLIWIVALGCVFVVTLTVSRGALAAAVIAILIGSRHFLIKGFVPILILAVMGFGLFVLGVFDSAIHDYGVRGTEDSGRLALWPLIVERIVESPFIGVGIEEVKTFVPSKQKAISPHNGILFLGLSSGIIPVVLLLAYWSFAGWRIWHGNMSSERDAPFHLPLLIYTFLEALQSNILYMQPWAIVAISVVMMARSPVVALQSQKKGGL